MIELWHIAIPVENLERSVDFYCGKLGFSLLGYDEFSSKKQAFVEITPGGVNLELFEPKKDREKILPRKPDHLAFEVPDIEHFHRHMVERGVSVPEIDTYEDVRTFSLVDPDGLALEIFQGRKNYEAFLREQNNQQKREQNEAK